VSQYEYLSSFQGPQLGLRLTWAGASTPEADINAVFLNVTQIVDLCHVIYSVSDLQVHWCTGRLVGVYGTCSTNGLYHDSW